MLRLDIERVILILVKKNQTMIYLAVAPLPGGQGGPLPGQGARSDRRGGENTFPIAPYGLSRQLLGVNEGIDEYKMLNPLSMGWWAGLNRV